MNIIPFEDKVYWVNPAQIVYSCEDNAFHYYLDSNKVVGGFWDYVAMSYKFEDSDVYIACKKVFIEKGNWEDTDYYQRVVAQINEGKIKLSCKTELEFKNRLKYKLTALYEDIKDDGYKQRHELVTSHQKLMDEITVNVGRYGDLLLNDGRHRLAIAKLLKIKQIPIRIVVFHKKWIEDYNHKKIKL